LPLGNESSFGEPAPSDGGIGRLATSLLAEADYPTEEFLTVYHWHWGMRRST